MAYKLSEYTGVAGQVASGLKSLGIVDSDQLLMLVTDPAQRAALLAKLGIDDRFLSDLTERADLTRLNGVGPTTAELLTQAGIRSVGDLAKATPAVLVGTLTKTAATFGAKRVPTEQDLTTWVAEAKITPDIKTWSTQVRISELKKPFAEDEWAKVRLAPLAAAALVIAASPSKGSEASEEFAVVGPAVDEARAAGSDWSLLNVAFAKGISTDDVTAFIKETPPSAMMSTVKAAVSTVAAKAPADAAAYRAMIMTVATKVAEAAKEGGFLGMGKKVISDQEQAVLTELHSAIGL